MDSIQIQPHYQLQNSVCTRLPFLAACSIVGVFEEQGKVHHYHSARVKSIEDSFVRLLGVSSALQSDHFDQHKVKNPVKRK